MSASTSRVLASLRADVETMEALVQDARDRRDAARSEHGRQLWDDAVARRTENLEAVRATLQRAEAQAEGSACDLHEDCQDARAAYRERHGYDPSPGFCRHSESEAE